MKIEIKNTKNKGRGVFATALIHKGELISSSPCIPITLTDMTPESKLWKYVFNYTNSVKLLSLDFTSLINHSEIPNVEYQVISQTEIKFSAVKDICEGEELTINYGYKVHTDVDWNEITTNRSMPELDMSSLDLYTSEIPHGYGKNGSRIQLIKGYGGKGSYRGKGNCQEMSLNYINRECRSGKCRPGSPISLVEVPYAIQGLQGSVSNSDMIAMFTRNQSSYKNRVLMTCFIIMRHMRNLYHRPSYYFSPDDYEYNLPSQEVTDLLNRDLELTGICMRIAYVVDFPGYLKRYPERLDELEEMSVPFKLKKLTYKSNNHWMRGASIASNEMIRGLKDDCEIIYPDEI